MERGCVAEFELRLELGAFRVTRVANGRLARLKRKVAGMKLDSKHLLVAAWLSSALISAAAAEPYRIGVLYWSMNIPGQVAMRAGVEAQAAEINKQAEKEGLRPVELLPYVAGDGEEGIRRQIDQMNALVEQKVDLILVQPTDNAALGEGLKRANEAGIPVVAYDQYISRGKLSAYRTSDNYEAGWLNGEYIASKATKNKALKVILVDYPYVSSTVERLNGFLDALAKAEIPYKILKSYQAVEPESGAAAGAAILRDFPAPGSVDVVFTINDGGGMAVVEALLAAGRSEILHATIDGDPRSVENIRQGKNTVVNSAQFCGPLGAEAMKASHELLTTGSTAYHALVPVFPVTQETLGQYPGWNGPIPRELGTEWPSLSGSWSGEIKVVK